MSALDPITGKLLDKAFTEVEGIVTIILNCKTSGEELKVKLSSVKPIIDEIIKIDSDSDASPRIVREYKKFQAELNKGFELVEKLVKTGRFDIFRKYRYAKRVQDLQKKLYDFIALHGSLDVILNGRKVGLDVSRLRECIVGTANAGMTSDPNINAIMLQKIDPNPVCPTPSYHKMHEVIDAEQSVKFSYPVPEMPKEFVVGLANPVNAVKNILLESGVNVVGVTGMGGSGKTTLVSALCNDTKVKDFFNQNDAIFITISKFPKENSLLEVLKTMWDAIIGGVKPHFESEEDAQSRLQNKLNKLTADKKFRPTLMVLDDVWYGADLKYLLFKANGYKTIFTSRDGFTCPIIDGITYGEYKMPMLDEANALSLLCFSAFGQRLIPATEKEELGDLVEQVAKECKGLPLALKVIGSSLSNQTRPHWESARIKLARAEYKSADYNEKVLSRLQMSIDILDDETKECFLDLGAFPEGRKFRVDYLLDIWVYVRDMEPLDAYVVLLELAKRNLLNISTDSGSGAIESSGTYDLCFSQHDIMRDLALRLGRQDNMGRQVNIIQRKRLFMPCKEDKIPRDWKKNLTNQSSGAEFLSIHTGAMTEQDWCQIDFPEVEALALFFAGTKSEYCLPTFLHTMPKLKVVFIYNYGSKRATLQGLPSFSSFTQIKSVLLEKLKVSPLYEDSISWESLEKLYVCLCEGLGNMSLWYKDQVLKFPKILEINIDHCSDLEELPGQMCNLTSLERLYVTNCHRFRKLPDGLGRLSSLKELRLYACQIMSELPPIFCQLQNLELLDISLCRSLKDLPTEFDQLSNLQKLYMRECPRLKTLPRGVTKLRCLRRVICDDGNIEKRWRAMEMPNLKIHAVQESFGLDWLDLA